MKPEVLKAMYTRGYLFAVILGVCALFGVAGCLFDHRAVSALAIQKQIERKRRQHVIAAMLAFNFP